MPRFESYSNVVLEFEQAADPRKPSSLANERALHGGVVTIFYQAQRHVESSAKTPIQVISAERRNKNERHRPRVTLSHRRILHIKRNLMRNDQDFPLPRLI